MKQVNYLFLFLALLVVSCNTQTSDSSDQNVLETKTEGKYTYQISPKDPMNTRIYTLENGLTVYLSKYQATPRIYTQIAVKAGGKNDPAETTGLAHYLEHMLFKGTHDFGTKDWEKESVLLDSIKNMFEHYRTLTDENERKAYYEKIDKISYEASGYMIANEYDKMLQAIGAKGTNAYTTDDRTVYINDIPANQIDNWLSIEANRFQTIVNRGFHTELEAVYEEKNRSLDSDDWKIYLTTLANVFPKHQYGTQTVIGTIDHLKNPSIKNIEEYFYKYYRPNNVAICLSGDLEYDKTIQLIDEKFKDWKPNNELEEWVKIEEDPITEPKIVEVVGPEEEYMWMTYRFDATNYEELMMVTLTDMLLANSAAGLIDLNLVKSQEILDGTSFVYDFNDYAMHILQGQPREGQTLEEVRTALKAQIEKIKKGEFDDWLLDAVVNDLKLNNIKELENNRARTAEMVTAFTTGIPWTKYVGKFDAMKKVTKQQIIDFANKHYNDNYVVTYKKSGEVVDKQKVEKPAINPIQLDRENTSDFVQNIVSNKPPKLKPLFLDFKKDVKQVSLKENMPLLYVKNNENELFELYYLIETGKDNDPKLALATEYLKYLGTDKMSADDFAKELYKIGCTFDVSVGSERTYVTLSGLKENMEQGIKLFEDLLENAVADEDALANLKADAFKKRTEAKKNKRNIIFGGLLNYGIYGEKSPFNNVLSNKELADIESAELLNYIHNIKNMEHSVMYYGPNEMAEIEKSIANLHKTADKLSAIENNKTFEKTKMDESKVYWTNYDMVQEEIIFVNNGKIVDPLDAPEVRLYNAYFGGGMNSVVFQEIRESRALAYATYAQYQTSSKKDKANTFFAYVGTQADKQKETMDAMLSIMTDLPVDTAKLETAKTSIMSRIESERIMGSDILFEYLDAKRKGIDYDERKLVYEKVPALTFEDIQKFQTDNIKNANFTTVLIGDKSKIDFTALKKYGIVKELTLDELFGYADDKSISNKD